MTLRVPRATNPEPQHADPHERLPVAKETMRPFKTWTLKDKEAW